MKKEELKKKLEPKKFNDVTMEFLTTAVNDVLELYGEYISEDVIIERIKQNLDKDIEFERNLGKNIAGSYNFGEKNIKIKKKSIDEERQVFFHVFLHPHRVRGGSKPCNSQPVRARLHLKAIPSLASSGRWHQCSCGSHT